MESSVLYMNGGVRMSMLAHNNLTQALISQVGTNGDMGLRKHLLGRWRVVSGICHSANPLSLPLTLIRWADMNTYLAIKLLIYFSVISQDTFWFFPYGPDTRLIDRDTKRDKMVVFPQKYQFTCYQNPACMEEEMLTLREWGRGSGL
jgi:hypothetical protein